MLKWKCLNVQMFKHSNAELLKCLNGRQRKMLGTLQMQLYEKAPNKEKIKH